MIMLEKLETCFDRLQTLDIKPTLDNMEKLLQTLYDRREVYQKLKEGEACEEADTERRNRDRERGSRLLTG